MLLEDAACRRTLALSVLEPPLKDAVEGVPIIAYRQFWPGRSVVVVGVSPPGPPISFSATVYLLYLDGSGAASVSDTAHRSFVLLGLSLPEGNWFALEKRVAALKAKYQFSAVPLELHAKDVCVSIPEQDEIPGFDDLSYADRRAQVLARREAKLVKKAGDRQNARAKYRGTEPVIHLSRAQRSQLYQDALDLVGSHAEIRLFAEVVNKEYLLKKTGKMNAVASAFEQVLSRFDMFLQFVARANTTAHNGIAVVDVDPHSDLMRDLTIVFRADGHSWGQLQHVIESPFFVDSKIVSGIQLADMCAYATRRYADKVPRSGSHEEKQFLRIFHKFDRGGGKLHGLRHYCAPGSCDCAICQERGHA